MKESNGAIVGINFIQCMMILALCFISFAYADEADELIKEGEELYQTRHLALGRHEQAIELYEKALALRPNDYTVLWKLAKMYQSYGEMLGKEEKQGKIELWKKGITYGERAVEANPDGKEGHFYYMANMGALARTEGVFNQVWKFRTIKKEMDRTLKLDPNFAPGLVARAQYLNEMPGIFGGDEAEAIRLFKRALELDPEYIIVYYYLAQIDAKHRRYDEAIAKLEKIINCKNPGNYANWATMDRPWAESLLRDILKEKEAAQKVGMQY